MIIIKTRIYYSDPKGRMFLSAAAFLLTIAAMIALNILRLYAEEKFPQYIPENLTVSTAPLPQEVIAVIMIAVAVLYVLFIIILLPMWYRSFKYVINDKEIISCSGIFSRTFRIMKLSAVQHVSRISLPLSEITCFNFISVNALGGRLYFMFLSGRDCTELMKFFRELSAAAAPEKRFALERDAAGNADYVYRDNSGLDGADDILEQLSGFSQLSFDDQQQSENEQLKFN